MPEIICNNDGTITISVTIELQGNMMEMETRILDAVNEVGCVATGEALKRFDSDGSPIMMSGVKWTVKGQDPKKYQTPYGVAEVERYVYQTSKGGRSFAPWKKPRTPFLMRRRCLLNKSRTNTHKVMPIRCAVI
jgi:hypothetical protein